MSGHFSRLSYDKNFLNEVMNQSTGPGSYNLYTGQNENDNSCHSLNGTRNNRSRNTSEVTIGEHAGVRAAVENNLQNRDLPASKSTNPNTIKEKNDELKKIGLGDNNVYCGKQLNPIYSRLQQPIDNFRGLSTMNLQVEHPIIDPRENVFNGHNKTSLNNQQMNSRHGKSTRLESKDEYSKVFKS